MADDKTDRGGRRGRLWKTPTLVTALLLLIPVLGNRFVDGWNWGAITLILWNREGSSVPPGALRAFGLNGSILILFVGSALLFRRAAREQTTTNAA